MQYVKKETAIPGKKVTNEKGEEVKVTTEIETQEYANLPEAVNAAKGENNLLAFVNQTVAQRSAGAFRIAYNAAIADKKTEEEAIAIGRAEAKKVYPSVRGPSKKEAEQEKDADFRAMLADAIAGKLSKDKVALLSQKYGVAA